MFSSTQSPNDLRTAQDREYAINSYASLWTIKEEMFSEYGQAGLEKASGYMDQLYKLTQKHQVEMALAVYPWPDQIVHEDLDSIQVKFLARMG